MKLFKTGVDSSEVRCRSARTVDYKSRIVSEEINRFGLGLGRQD